MFLLDFHKYEAINFWFYVHLKFLSNDSKRRWLECNKKDHK